jgi:hypothetical protein
VAYSGKAPSALTCFVAGFALARAAAAQTAPVAPPPDAVPLTAPVEKPQATAAASGGTATGATTPVSAASTDAPVAPAGRSDAEEIRRLRADVDTLKAELDEVRVNGAEHDNLDRKLDIYGFTDMGIQRVWSRPSSAISGTGSPRALTFVLGNANLYFDATPVTGWRGLTEIRITNYPDGALRQPAVPALGIPEDRVNTTVFDVNAPDPGWNEVRWGSIVLEQAWIQGTASDLLSVRLGYFLTPFGIWSIDHGTPTLIALDRPQFTRGRSFPDHQLGLQALGQVMKGSWTYGYVAYVSNGKTQGGLDPSDDKAFGARLTAATTRPVRLTIGLSGYTGRYSQVVKEGNASDLAVTEREAIAYKQWDVGADVSLDVDNFRLRTEGVLERVEYRDGHRDTALGIPGTQWPDRTLWAYYLLGAYQLPWWGLEPYVSGELFRFPTPLAEGALIPGIGLNVHFTTEVQLKTQFARAHFFDFDGEDHSAEDTSMLATRLVLAF